MLLDFEKQCKENSACLGHEELWQHSGMRLLWCPPGSHRASLQSWTCTWFPYLGQDPAPKLPRTLEVKCSGPCQGPARPSGARPGWHSRVGSMSPVGSCGQLSFWKWSVSTLPLTIRVFLRLRDSRWMIMGYGEFL